MDDAGMGAVDGIAIVGVCVVGFPVGEGFDDGSEGAAGDKSPITSDSVTESTRLESFDGAIGAEVDEDATSSCTFGVVG